ncbi:TetR/AcrR family transcriptional regulator [Deinococcus sp.]|uniref:TetR/AcrR family transcriptional regulator n=1 Tax=Deinococcus sp. TaxID=47478 RepID=UPI003C7D6504
MRETARPRTDGSEAGAAPGGLRERILNAAIDLLGQDGPQALTTRAVAAAAGIQAPTLYRLFGDKSALLDAVAEHGFLTYLREKRGRVLGTDPVDNLRAGWNLHVDFGLTHPALFSMMSGNLHSGVQSPAAAAGVEHLRRQIVALAVAGRLRVSEDRAVGLMRAAGLGTVLTLLELPADRRHPGLSEIAREAVIAAIVMDAPTARAAGAAGAAVALRALLPGTSALTPGELALMTEWLDRLASGPE